MRIFCRNVSYSFAFICLLAASLSGLPVQAGVNRWTQIGPDGADVSALLIDPRTPSTVVAGTRGAGVLKTLDGGNSWATIGGTLPTSSVSAMAFVPSGPSTLYAGTDAGVFRSNDGGKSWAAASDGRVGAPQGTVSAIAIDGGSPATIFAATPGGVFKTIDGATSWTSINAGLAGLEPRLLAISASSPTTLYVAVEDAQNDVDNGVFLTADSGATWTRVYTSPFVDDEDGGSFALSVTALAVDPSTPSRLYLALSDGSVMKTENGGRDWTVISSLFPNVSAIAFEPGSSTTVYAGTGSGVIHRSVDAGAHWTLVADSPLATNRVNVFAVSRSAPGVVYAGSGGGIVRSSDGGAAWARLFLGVGSTRVHPLAVDPSAASTIYSAYNDVTGIFTKTTDGGAHWSNSGIGVPGQIVNSLVVDPTSPLTLYAGMGPASSGSNLYKSTDGGAHWFSTTTGMFRLSVQALAVAPSHGSTVYAGIAGAGVLKSVDGGSTWAWVNDGLNARLLDVTALAIDPTNADALFVAIPPASPKDPNARVFKSTNGAARWSPISIAIPSGAAVTSLAIDPTTPSIVYAGYVDYVAGEGGVFRSKDGGDTWTSPQNRLPTTWGLGLTLDPHAPSQVYAATQSGVYKSMNGAVNWSSFSSGLPTLDVWSISIDRTGSLLRAATSGGLVEYQVASSIQSTVAQIEYIHAAFGHYFITSDLVEIGKLDRGLFEGWTRTGLRFNAYATPNDNSVSVCRFFSDAFAPKSSHFYTPFANECAMRRADPAWILESTEAFDIALPAADGTCAAGYAPVYRLYNNGQGGAPNHRYTTDLAIRAQMISQGWIPEGLGPNAVEMCSPP